MTTLLLAQPTTKPDRTYHEIRAELRRQIAHLEADLPLGPGMSVVPTVRIDPTPSLYERLADWL